MGLAFSLILLVNKVSLFIFLVGMGLDDSPIGEIFCLGELLSFICNVLSQWMYS